MIKYPKIYTVGHEYNEMIFLNPKDEIIIEEKIDGANFRFMITDENQLIFGSRRLELVQDGDHKWQKNFTRCISFIQDALRDKDLSRLKGYILFGECVTSHTLSYDWDKIPPYLGFDIINLKNDTFLDYNTKIKIFTELNLPIVPLIKTCKAKDIVEINDNMVPISFYAPKSNPKQKAEGIVFKNNITGVRAKYVRNEFKEANSKTFGGNPKYNKVDDTNNAEFVFKYCTNARIDKTIFKLVDEHGKLEMALMRYLPKAVYTDIWEEHWQSIMDSRWKLDLNGIRKLITKRCGAILKQVIINNSLK